jgi:hypothetical protein
VLTTFYIALTLLSGPTISLDFLEALVFWVTGITVKEIDSKKPSAHQCVGCARIARSTKDEGLDLLIALNYTPNLLLAYSRGEKQPTWNLGPYVT